MASPLVASMPATPDALLEACERLARHGVAVVGILSAREGESDVVTLLVSDAPLARRVLAARVA